MKLKPVIQILIEPVLKKEKWILKEVFLRVGFPFTFVSSWNDLPIKISYGIADGNEDLILPIADKKWKTVDLPSVNYVESQPIAHLPGYKPNRLREHKRLLFDIVGMGEYFLSGRGKFAEVIFNDDKIKKARAFFSVPLLDIGINALRGIIEIEMISKGITRIKDLRQKPFDNWTITMTHDVDHIRIGGPFNFISGLIQATKLFINNEEGREKKNRVLRKAFYELVRYGLKGVPVPIEAAIDVERKHGILSTIFVYGGQSHRPLNPCYNITRHRIDETNFVKFLLSLKKEGWILGLHGSTYSSTSKSLLSQEIKNLRECLDCNTILNRYHRLCFSPEQSVKILVENSVAIDSSFGFNKIVGFSCGTALPFFLFSKGDLNRSVLEIPIIIHDIPLLREAEGKIENIKKNTLELINRLHEHSCSGIINILFHFETFLKKPFNEEGLKFYEEYLKLLSAHNCSFMTLKAVEEKWKAYQKRLWYK